MWKFKTGIPKYCLKIHKTVYNRLSIVTFHVYTVIGFRPKFTQSELSLIDVRIGPKCYNADPILNIFFIITLAHDVLLISETLRLFFNTINYIKHTCTMFILSKIYCVKLCKIWRLTKTSSLCHIDRPLRKTVYNRIYSHASRIDAGYRHKWA